MWNYRNGKFAFSVVVDCRCIKVRKSNYIIGEKIKKDKLPDS